MTAKGCKYTIFERLYLRRGITVLKISIREALGISFSLASAAEYQILLSLIEA